MLDMIGFTATGVAANSLAAAWQSSIGNVAAGSLFAWMQSTAAAGGAWAVPWAMGAAGLVVAAAKRS
jgi:hypothetical protein